MSHLFNIIICETLMVTLTASGTNGNKKDASVVASKPANDKIVNFIILYI